MDITTTSYPAPAASQAPSTQPGAVARLLDWLAAGWHRSTLEADERYLAAAVDMHELEQRVAVLQRGDDNACHRLWA